MLTAVKKDIGFHLKLNAWNASIVADIKAIDAPERNYVVAEKIWFVSLKKENDVRFILKKYNGVLNEDEKPVSRELPPMPELMIDIPLKRVLRPYQRTGVARGLELKRFINGDEPGLGKTTESIATIVGANAFPVLVVVPASLKINWQMELNTVAGIKAMILSDATKKTFPSFISTNMCKVFIVNYESLKKFFVLDIKKSESGSFKLSDIRFNPNINLFKSVIFDELHKCKDGKTLQTKLSIGVAHGKEYVIGLTGTPVVNKPKDLISQLTIINKLSEVFGNYKVFMDRYCGGMKGTGAFNLDELSYKLMSNCFFQRKKRDVLKDLPEKVYQIVYCDITTREEYNRALNDLASYLREYKDKSDEQIETSMRGEIMVSIGVCKQISARGKMNEVQEYVEEIMDADEKVGIFIYHKEIAARIKQMFPSALLYTGAQSDDEKNKAIHEFQRCTLCDVRFENHTGADHVFSPSKSKLIALSIKSGGVGLTLTAASRMAVVELPWHAADCTQIEDRFHRISQLNSVQCTYFMGKDTIDEHIYSIIERKRVIANAVLGTNDDFTKEIVDKFVNLFNEGKIKAV